MKHTFASGLLRSAVASTMAGLLLCGSVPARAEEDGAPAPAAAAPSAGKADPAAAAGVVNLNSASVEELARLPGVGPRKAEAIVARREKKRFARPEELVEIKGIGRGIYKRCKPYLRVQGPTTLAQKVASPRR
ncbi:MAG: helix-hairpin-helix domain-containing protein [Deltaproteobacteria bacterium]|nr:helix-hairpin-helix domain-containing protein [Deltaproteobacteria bacterium]